MKINSKAIMISKYNLCLHNKKFREILLVRNMITYSCKMIRVSKNKLHKAKRSSFFSENFGEQSIKKHNEKIRRASIKITRFERWKQLRE